MYNLLNSEAGPAVWFGLCVVSLVVIFTISNSCNTMSNCAESCKDTNRGMVSWNKEECVCGGELIKSK